MKFFLIVSALVLVGFSIYYRSEIEKFVTTQIRNKNANTMELKNFNDLPIIVVGSGLAGLVSAAKASQNYKNILILEKNAQFGGNSFKATSGINAAVTKIQKENNIEDSVDLFTQDTMFSYHGGEDIDSAQQKYEPALLVQLMTSLSASTIQWLTEDLKIDLSQLTRLGGHSQTRSHRPAKGVVGQNLVNGVHKYLQEQQKDRVNFIYNAQVTKLIQNKDGRVVGVEYTDLTDNKQIILKAVCVILTTGGFGNDHTDTSLLKEFASAELQAMPTTNGPWTQGEGMKMARQIGAELIDMEHIQIHPTGFVDPSNPTDSTKILAPEALRAVGGILLNNDGKRFVNELTLRSKVVEAMQKNKGPFKLVMNEDSKNKFGPNFNFYFKVKGFFKRFENCEELAQSLKADKEVVHKTLTQYQKSIENGKDEFGKTYFPTSFNPNEALYAAEITPVVHYTMGGIKIDTGAQVLNKQTGKPIIGLYAAGEATGGVHHKNRLGGNSLLDCATFGTVAGIRAGQYASFLQVSNKKQNDEI